MKLVRNVAHAHEPASTTSRGSTGSPSSSDQAKINLVFCVPQIRQKRSTWATSAHDRRGTFIIKWAEGLVPDPRSRA